MMEQLWAPWRMELIRNHTGKSECFFCEYIKQNDDEKNLILERDEFCFVIMNRYPYNNGHLMIVPYPHTGKLEQLEPNVRCAMMEKVTQWQALLKGAINAQGFNIGINIGHSAGAGVADHIHIHIVPRWIGDTNFMPVLGETKVINQDLEELYHELKQYRENKAT